jgi:hypothetical protein
LTDEQRRAATQIRDFTTGGKPFGALGYDPGEAGCGSSFQGQKISVLLKAGQSLPEETSLAMSGLTQLSNP